MYNGVPEKQQTNSVPQNTISYIQATLRQLILKGNKLCFDEPNLL
jgi:hypothetical protein